MEKRIELLTEMVDEQEMIVGLKIGNVKLSADALESLGNLLTGDKTELMEDYNELHTRVLRDMAKDGVYDEMVDDMLTGIGNLITNYCRGIAA